MLQVPLTGSYSSDGATFPTTSTSPVFSRVEEWELRARLMLPVGLHVPVTGSYSSADDTLWPPAPISPETPPLTRTLPLARRVAPCANRAWLRGPVRLHLPVTGS